MQPKTIVAGLLAITGAVFMTACGDGGTVTLNTPQQPAPAPDPDPDPDPGPPAPSASGDILVFNAVEDGPDTTAEPVQINNAALQFGNDPAVYGPLLNDSGS